MNPRNEEATGHDSDNPEHELKDLVTFFSIFSFVDDTNEITSTDTYPPFHNQRKCWTENTLISTAIMYGMRMPKNIW